MDINALREKLDNSQYIYLYGAGLAGINYLQRFTRQLPCRPIEGIVVSEKEGNPEKIGGGGQRRAAFGALRAKGRFLFLDNGRGKVSKGNYTKTGGCRA